MQLFPGLMLNGAGIVLQPVDVFAELLIFCLQLLHLVLQRLCLFALMGKCGETVVPEDDTVGHHQGEGSSGNRCSATPPEIGALLRSSGECRELRGQLRFALHGSQL